MWKAWGTRWLFAEARWRGIIGSGLGIGWCVSRVCGGGVEVEVGAFISSDSRGCCICAKVGRGLGRL